MGMVSEVACRVNFENLTRTRAGSIISSHALALAPTARLPYRWAGKNGVVVPFNVFQRLFFWEA